MRSPSVEAKIAKWASRFVGGSYVVIALIVLSVMAFPKIVNGEIMDDPFLLKALLISILYLASVLLVASLPGKSTSRRAVSWVASIIFHSGLLVYLGIFNEWGSIILFIGMVETIILVLSSIGLGLLIYGHYNNESA